MFEDTNWGETFLGLFVIVFVSFAVFGLYSASKENIRQNAEMITTVTRMGENPTDVEIFLRGSDFKMKDFINSPSLQKQYERFKEGDDVDFIENNRANRQIRNAKSRANSAQAIATVSMVTAMSRR